MSLTITASEETLAALIPTLLERIRTLEAVNASMKSTQKILHDTNISLHAEIKQLKAQLGQTTDVFQLFATDKLVADTNFAVKVSEARVAFKEWARFNPGYPAILTMKQFVARLADMPGAELTGDGRIISGYKLTDD